MTVPVAAGCLQPPWPDPLLAANVYCRGRLDEAICRVAAPFWRGFRTPEAAGEAFLWFVRYWRRGEHLKLRLHAPGAERERARGLLSSVAESFFDALGGRAAAAELGSARGREEPIAIDAEDLDATPARDHSLVWTLYRRSPVLLGDEALFADDGYAARMTRCFGSGCEIVMESLRLDEGGACPHGLRQSVLLRLVAAGLAAACSSAEQRAAYLAFHRDWMVRYPVLVLRRGDGKAVELLALLEREASKLGEGALAAVAAVREEAASGTRGEGRDAAWRRALSELQQYLTGVMEDPAYSSDPFADGPLFPSLFKVFHQLANQLGVKTLDEALAHHLLLRAGAKPGAKRRFVFLPGPAGATAAAGEESESQTHPLDASYPWNDLVSLASVEGRQWVEQFLAVHQGPLEWSQEALRLLRAHPVGDERLAQAAALLDRVQGETRALAAADAAAYGVLGRFYFGTVAYYHYCRGDCELAASTLDRANACLIAAVSVRRCLLPASPLNADIPLQKARIARRRRRWLEMARHLGELRDMQADRLPLCVLADGTEVFYRTLGVLFGAGGELTAGQQLAVHNLLDARQRLRAVDRRTQQLYTPAHLLIWSR